MKTPEQIQHDAKRLIAMRQLIDWYCGHKTNDVSIAFMEHLRDEGVLDRIARHFRERQNLDDHRQ
jgi:hypothetical protein